ncbi:HNH endonuclease signature motif containing protein [Rhodococcus opacus]|uniref:HNH endonuclease signature motif containing protein n=1 Tax=Rhodococcus opacus TaxID=37919 RepID=UPI002948EE02|nr:HNH endonuclease [Rhodococcus opacus]MDV6246876.1 HNH endonuclease [Rhodococcus opacus]
MSGINRAERQRREELLAQGLKECSKGCGPLPLDRFHPRADGFAGLRGECVECKHEAGAEYRRANPEAECIRARTWQKANPDRFREITKRWRDQNRIAERLRSGRYRAEKLGLAADNITTEQLLADWERRGIDPTKCVYTGQPLQDGWHLDHAVPLSAPGTPGHVVSNLVPANPRQNSTKHARHWIDYLADRAEAQKESVNA